MMTGRKIYQGMRGQYAFWLSNIGMIGMTTAFAAAGVAQVYLERKVGMDFMDVQNEIAVHFIILIGTASLFTVGIILYIIDFVKYGRPTDEAVSPEEDVYIAVSPDV